MLIIYCHRNITSSYFRAPLVFKQFSVGTLLKNVLSELNLLCSGSNPSSLTILQHCYHVTEIQKRHILSFTMI
uniref:Uncharacterized protein n=1 Tax=Anguilla anguilla TaxID=7936 RepID=A0A0E9RLM5_ANGAN